MNIKRSNDDDDPFSIVSKKRQSEPSKGPIHVKKPFTSIDAYTKHKMLINQYMLDHVGATKKLQRDTSKDVTEFDVLKANHKFLWNETDQTDSWQARVAKKYYDKLFKEYCISDLKRYKENKIALRWRTEKEVVKGKGQFTCADLNCDSRDLLKSWEVNFGYVEHGEKKNALVKIRLCSDCSYKLNYHHKKKEVKKIRKVKLKKEEKVSMDHPSDLTNQLHEPSTSSETIATDFSKIRVKQEQDEEGDNIWTSKQPLPIETESNIETEMDEYLSELFM